MSIVLALYIAASVGFVLGIAVAAMVRANDA